MPDSHKPLGSWLRAHGFALRLLGCGTVVALTTGIAGTIYEGNLFWVANGVLLSYLLLAPRRRWPAYLGAALVGHALGTACIHTAWQVYVIDMPLDLSEALLSAFLLRRRSAQLPQFTNRTYLFRFFFIAVLASPLACAFSYALVESLWLHSIFSTSLSQWFTSDALGVCITTPACVAIFRTRIKNFLGTGWKLSYPLLLAAATCVIFSQAQAPLSFLLYPLLILILFRLGLGWAAASTTFIAAVGGWFTVHDFGPFASYHALSLLEPAFILQIFVATTMLTIYGVSVVLEDLDATQRRLHEALAKYQLVTENSRDVLIIADFSGHRTFVSSGCANWSGWNAKELLQHRSLEMAHPEDRPKIQAALQELRNGKDGALIEYRAQTREGDYIWIESSLRTIRNTVTNIPEGILSSVREITERKLAEQQLQNAYHALESLAITDALTGLANRRQFDQTLATEWRRGMRDSKPLSMLLIDVDLFKTYNDSYGHLRGDSCLKQIAEAALAAVARPSDIVARFGGEEFAVILPNTAGNGAIQLARDICAIMRSRHIVHDSNPIGIVTVSVGCATLVPKFGLQAASIIEQADKALYQAKRSGRNRACAYRTEENAGAPAGKIELTDNPPAFKNNHGY
jgi:diguanylate cyclase (GGDEF)-like protein/PAS domain S-box-containing protein